MSESKHAETIIEPYVGMGATELMYSDRHAYTVMRVISPNMVIVTRDKAKRIDRNGMSDCQSYEYESTPLVESEPAMRCCHPLHYLLEQEPECCVQHSENGTCVGCERYRKAIRTNGIKLRKCKRGWKQVGADQYFALGVREEYFDYSF